METFDSLYKASHKVCRNVRWKDSTIKFEANRLQNIFELQDELENGSYQQMNFSAFSIVERGKQRDIRACHIYDRMLQNSLCEQELIPQLIPKFVYDNSATLKGKGIYFALSRAKIHLQEASQKYDQIYCLRLDIKKYFDSINHEALKQQVEKNIQGEEIIKLVKYIIDTFDYKLTKDTSAENGKTYYRSRKYDYQVCGFGDKVYEKAPYSLGLGSQASQLLALLTLNGIDHFIKEQLKIKEYGRYMDDIYLIHSDKKYLAYCREEIRKELAKIGLTLNDKKTKINKIDSKIPFKFLKWNFFILSKNKVIIVPTSRKMRKMRVRIRKQCKKGISYEDLRTSFNGYCAHLKVGNTYYIRQNLLNFMDKEWHKSCILQ